jgi:hypothetical protein
MWLEVLGGAMNDAMDAYVKIAITLGHEMVVATFLQSVVR